MKTKLIILSLALIVFASGCEQKSELDNKPATANQDNKQKTQEVVETAKKITKEPDQAGKSLPQTVEQRESKSAPVTQESTEQSLADISKHGREVTKTQVSKSRTRAQMAEDEMTKDLEKFK